MRELVRILCGSQLYGTNIPSSDRDFKIVYLPSGLDILLQRGHLPFGKTQREAAEAGLQNYLEDYDGPMDIQYLTAQRFLELLCKGHSQVWDMIFAPEASYLGPVEPEWYTIKNNIKFFMSRNMGRHYLVSPRGWMRRWEMNDKGHIAPLGSDLEPGEWKNAAHSIRILEQFIELMETKEIAFPLKDKALLKAIRRGRVPYKTVQQHAAALLGLAAKAAKASNLNNAPDPVRAEALVKMFHQGELLTCSRS